MKERLDSEVRPGITRGGNQRIGTEVDRLTVRNNTVTADMPGP